MLRFGLLVMITLSVAMPALGEDCNALVGKTFLADQGDPPLDFAEKRADGIYLNQTIPPGQKFQVIELVLIHYGTDQYLVLTRDGRELSIACPRLMSALDRSYFGQHIRSATPEDFSDARAIFKAKQDASDAEAAGARARSEAKAQADLAELEQRREAEKREHEEAVAREAKRAREERAASARYIAERLARGGVKMGMSQQQVLASSWGEPDKRNHNITPAGDAEQWVYPHQHFLYFNNGTLTGIQTDSPNSGFFQVAH